MGTLELSWQAAVAIVGGIMAITAGAVTIAKFWRSMKTTEQQPITKGIAALETDLKELESKLSEMQITLDGKVGTQIQNIDSQITEIKGSITRLQDKLEKLTDIIIKNFSSRGDS